MAKAVAVKGRHLVTDGVRIHYLEYVNDYPPLVLIPGITSPAITWGFVSERLAEFAHVFSLDNRGRGLSSTGPDLSYVLEDYANDTIGAIQALGLERPTVVGHSMGARIAIKLAALASDKIAKLVLADPPVTGPGRRAYPTPLKWYLDGIDEASRGGGFETARKVLPNWTDEQLSLRAEWLPTCDKIAIEQSHRSFHEEDVHILLPQVRVPTLLIYAEKGGTVNDEDAAEIVSALPDASATRIDGASHMIPWDDLDSFVSAIRDFVVT